MKFINLYKKDSLVIYISLRPMDWAISINVDPSIIIIGPLVIDFDGN